MHTLTIAGRELRALFVSPVAYVVLTLWSVLAGSFFLLTVEEFDYGVVQLQQLQRYDELQMTNLNDHLIEPFLGSIWVFMLFLLPAVTMGLMSSEKANGTEELLLTSPISVWDIVFGKFLAGCGFVTAMIAIVAFYPGLLFAFGEPELGKTLSGLLCLLLIGMSYVSVGVFASSVTRSQVIAFFLALVLLMMIGMMLPVVVDVVLAGGGFARDSGLVEGVRWAATVSHVDGMVRGLIDTADIAYFVIASGAVSYTHLTLPTRS